MKTNPQQQRVMIPVLVVVLIGLVARLVTMLRGDDPPAPVIMSVQPGVTSPAATRTLAILPETSSRDPFFHPSLNRPKKAALSDGSDPQLPSGIASDPPPGAPQDAAWPLNVVPLAPKDPLVPIDPLAPIARMVAGTSPAVQQKIKSTPDAPASAHPLSALPTGPGTQTGAQGGGPMQGNPSELPSKSSDAELVARLKLTAILAGDRPSAVIEGYNAQPLIMHQGEAFGTLQVAAIHATEIVLSGPAGIWTLPLDTSAADSAAPAGTHKENKMENRMEDKAVATH